jgi:PAS domain S-box-containing protein
MTLLAGYISGRSEMVRTVEIQVENHFVQRLHLSQHILEEMLRTDNYGVIKPYISAFGMERDNRLAILVDGDGVVLASTRLELIGRHWKSIDGVADRSFLLSIEADAEKQVTHLDAEQVIVGYIKVCGYDGAAGIRRQGCGFFYQSLDTSAELLSAEKAAARQATFVGMGGLLAVLMLALILHRLVTRRSEHMIRVTQRFSNGDSSVRTGMSGNDELSSVGVALDSMFERINEKQQQLRDSESSLNRAQRIGHLGNWEWDILNGTLSWSDEVFRIFGWEPQSFTPEYEHFMQVIHPDDREKVQNALAQAIGDEAAEYRVEHRVVLHDKNVRYVQENGHIVRDAAGKAIAMTATVLDITERIKTEEELELFQLMIEKSADPAFLIDIDDNSRMAYVNEAAVQHFGYPRDEILRWHIPDWDPNFTYTDLAAHHAAMQARPGMTIETQHRVQGGRLVPVEVSLNPIRYRGRNCHFGYFKNISERKEVEHQLKVAKEQAEEATRIKSEFLANMSHEIRTPMNAIINLSYLAQEGGHLPSRTLDYIGKIESSANHLLGIINDILDFSKIEAGKLSIERAPFALRQMLDALSVVIGYRVVEKSIEVLFRIDPQVPNYLYGDVLRLTQILTNLLSNAIKFTNEGEVVLSIRSEASREGWAGLIFVVSDTGRGISVEEQTHLFKAFTQTDNSISRKYGGTGLGLVITQRLVEMMGGTIQVESDKGVGSRFSITLGLEINPERSTRLDSDDYPDLSKIRLLVVDDNETARAIFRENLDSFGIAADILPGAVGLLQRLRQHNCGGENPYDAVILDWKMPGIDGVEAARLIRHDTALTVQPRLLLCTAYGAGGAVEGAEEGLIDATMSKPFSPSSLLDNIVELLGYSVLSNNRTSTALGHELMAGLARRKGARILVVEDNEINQEIARELLQKVGMVVTVASLASEAFKALEEQKFDLVLMDIQMPEMDGLEATRHIRSFEQFATLPIVAMTAHAMESDRELSLAAGMNDHLTKPINPATLYQAITQWIVRDLERRVRNLDRGGESDGRASDGTPMIERRVASRLIPGINIELGVSKLAGNRSLYRQLLLKFRQRNRHADEFIAGCIAEQKFDKAVERLHSIKGVAGNLGAEQLFHNAKELEQAIKVKVGVTEISPLLEAFVAEHQRVMQGLDTLDSDSVGAVTAARSVDHEIARVLLDKLLLHVESDLGMAMEIASQLAAQMQGTPLEGEYVVLEQALSDFDIDRVQAQAAMILQHLAKV